MSEIAILMTVIGIYAIGAWITLFVIGMMEHYSSFFQLDEVEIGLTIVWPFTWLIALILCISFPILKFVYWVISTKVGKAVCKVGKVMGFVLAFLLLPFRPIALAKCLRYWLDKRAYRKRFAKGRECDGTMAAAAAALSSVGKEREL